MRKRLATMTVLASTLMVVWAGGQDVNPPFVHKVALDPNDTAEDILWKAANVVPSSRQMEYYEQEYMAFIHFGPNTFTGREWGDGKENPRVFNPGDTLDTDQWCRIIKEAGMKKVIITVKHHEGFCLWQTRYNDTFSVRATPWRNGQGDVLRDLAESCRKYGLRLGVYLSPADLYQMESEHGLYGNRSEYKPSVIPTNPDTFQSDPMQVREDRPADAPIFEIEADDYNRYFMNQLYELLTEYGPIHEVWFDGAHPKRKGNQQYIREEWFKMIRELAPDAVIFGGPDVRWVGNESGNTRDTEWNILPIQSKEVSGEDRPIPQPASDEALKRGLYEVYGTTYKSNSLYFMIAEVNTSIRAGWFWRDEDRQSVRSPDNVFDIYERSVGGNSVFLLNIAPSNQGLVPPRDEACLLEVGRRIGETYGTNLLEGAAVETGGRKIGGLIDGDLSTYWQPDDMPACLIVKTPEPITINRFAFQEAIADVGQRIARHRLDAWVDGEWVELAEATTVGFRRILRFPEVTTDRLRLCLQESRLMPTVAELAAHYYQPAPSAVTASQGADGKLELSFARAATDFNWKGAGLSQDTSTLAAGVVRYTLDGSEPTRESSVYTEPLSLPEGGLVKARVFVDGEVGPLLSERVGISREGWRIVNVSSQHAGYEAPLAIDGNPNTFWHSSWAQGHPEHPHSITIDLGRQINIAGIDYLPRQDRPVPDGRIESGRVEVSADGINWREAGEFFFGNLVNDPSRRDFWFEKPISGKYIRIVSKTGSGGRPYAGAADIGVIGAADR